MNCINCGAPPRRGAAECPYCETALDHLVEDVDHAGYQNILTTVQETSSDMRKVEVLALCHGPYTAGQVRQILSLFSSDMRRVEAAACLVPNTSNPSGLLGCSDLFASDMRRAEFVALLPRSARSVGPSSGSRPPRPPQPRHASPTTASPSQMVPLLLCVVALLLLLDLYLRMR